MVNAPTPMEDRSLAVAPSDAVRTTGFKTAFRDVEDAFGFEVDVGTKTEDGLVRIVLNGDATEEVGDTW